MQVAVVVQHGMVYRLTTQAVMQVQVVAVQAVKAAAEAHRLLTELLTQAVAQVEITRVASQVVQV
jgi:hypothetical protein